MHGVRDVMTAAPQTIEATRTLAEAARMMRDGSMGDVSSAPPNS